MPPPRLWMVCLCGVVFLVVYLAPSLGGHADHIVVRLAPSAAGTTPDAIAAAARRVEAPRRQRSDEGAPSSSLLAPREGEERAAADTADHLSADSKPAAAGFKRPLAGAAAAEVVVSPPVVRPAAPRPPMRAALGVRGPDKPYGRGADCHPTQERWQWESGNTDNIMPKSMGGKVSAACMAKIEPLNPHAPLKGAGVDSCAQNNRRWMDKKEFEGHMDYDATERRKKSVRFLASVCPPTANQRLVFFNAGCRSYDSSTAWFRKHYPRGADFDVYGLDVIGRHAPGFMKDKKAAFFHAAAWNETGFVSFLMKRDLEGDGVFHSRWLDQPVVPLRHKLLTVPAVAFGDFVMQRAAKEDFVVVKLDIEGAEWAVIQHLAESGALAYIDEMFVECHHGEWVPNWPSPHSLADCHRLFNTLRDSGVYAHEWY